MFDKKQVIILGNGFDLANDLPTNYSDFFSYLCRENASLYESLEKTIMTSKQSRYTEDDFSSGYRMNEHKERFSKIDKELHDEIEVIGEYVKNLMNSEYTISVWEIFFWNQRKKDLSIGDDTWANIETSIDEQLNQEKDSILNFNSMVRLEDIITESKSIILSLNPNKENSYSYHDTESYYHNIYDKCSKNKKLKFILILILQRRYEGTKRNIFDIMQAELRQMENNVKKYINLISDELINSKGGLRKYRDNFLSLLSEKELNYYVINFNYTDLSGKQTEEEFVMRRRNKEITIVQQNVHGVAYKNIIFGIDQSDVDAGSDKYLFTKTYRRMEAQNESNQIPLPIPKETSSIIFYGHSLSSADYSYFQSVFDYYNIYNSDIVLTFYFSYYGNEDEHWSIKKDATQLITKLMQRYGSAMSNRGNGKNLLHKMLLENRLQVKEISMKKIESKEFRESYL